VRDNLAQDVAGENPHGGRALAEHSMPADDATSKETGRSAGRDVKGDAGM
jgi:hypothetical protein